MSQLFIDGIQDLELVASGASALVYRGVDENGDTVAVKVFRGIRGREIQRRFQREVGAYERLAGHRSIAHLLDSGVTSVGEPYLVMPYFEHGSLQDELDDLGPFDLEQAVEDVCEACDALDFAHNCRVLHRDIKPGNLLRRDDGGIVLADFGIARVTDSGITSATLGASTPLYAAPEVLADQDASVASEIYSLGALLYTLLAGKPCFSGDSNIWATMRKIRTDIPPAIDGVPKPVMDLIVMAMSKDPTTRPKSAQEFAQYLRLAAAPDSSWQPPKSAKAPTYIDNVVPRTPSRDKGGYRSGVDVTTPMDIPIRHGRTPSTHSSVDSEVDSAFSEREKRSWISLAAVIAVIAVAAIFIWMFYRSVISNVNTTADKLPTIDTSLPSPEKPETITTGDNTSNSDGSSGGAGGSGGGDGGGSGAGGSKTDSESSTDTSTDGESSTGGSAGGAESGSDFVFPDNEAPPRAPSQDSQTDGDSFKPVLNIDDFAKIDSYHFNAVVPSGWIVYELDRNVGYGFRTELRKPNSYLNIDTTPAIQRDPNMDIRKSANEIAATSKNASEVYKRTVNGRTYYWFTFTNNQGQESIDIFFEHAGAGYAVVAGSSLTPDEAQGAAWLVAQTVTTE